MAVEVKSQRNILRWLLLIANSSMRVSIFLSGIILLIGSACHKEAPAGFVERKVYFKAYKYYPNLKGGIKIYMPIKFDTLLNWVDRSDAGGTIKLRFTNANGCLIQESGYIHVGVCEGNFDRLTIETDRIGPVESMKTDTTGFSYGAKQLERASRARVNQFVWHSKSIETINERTFSILEFFGSGLLGFNKHRNAVEEPFEQLIASTVLEQEGTAWLVKLRFECKQKDCRGFAKNAYTVLRSVEIDTVATKQK